MHFFTLVCSIEKMNDDFNKKDTVIDPSTVNGDLTCLITAVTPNPSTTSTTRPTMESSSSSCSNQQFTEASRAATRALVMQSTDSDGHVKEVKNVFDELGSIFGKMMGQAKPWTEAIKKAGFPNVEEEVEVRGCVCEICLCNIVAEHF